LDDPTGSPQATGPATDEPAAPPAEAGTAETADDARTVQTVVPVEAATRERRSRTPAASRYRSFTSAGAVLGTPRTCRPRPGAGEASTPRSDIYSLGALLYELAAGVPPHPGDSQPAVRSATLAPTHRRSRPPCPASILGSPRSSIAACGAIPASGSRRRGGA